MKLDSAISETIKSVVERELYPARIEGVFVEEDVDFDGDDILKITVVFAAEGRRPDPDKVISLPRHLREPLERLREDRFPMFTFMTPGDLDGEAA